MSFTLSFINVFFLVIAQALPLVLSLALVIIVLGQIVGRREQWGTFDAFYWSWITATTVGYGDIRPAQKTSKIISIAIAFMGLVITGIIVAIAVFAATEAFTAHTDISALRTKLSS